MNSGNFLSTFFHDAILPFYCHITVVLDISGNVKGGVIPYFYKKLQNTFYKRVKTLCIRGEKKCLDIKYCRNRNFVLCHKDGSDLEA